MSVKVKGMKDLEKALGNFTKNFEIYCMNCGKKYKVNLNKTKAKCPKCKTEMKIS